MMMPPRLALLLCSLLLADGLQTAPERLRALLSRDARESRLEPSPGSTDATTDLCLERELLAPSSANSV